MLPSYSILLLIARNKVVLPLPLIPTIETILFLGTLIDTLFKTSFLSYPHFKFSIFKISLHLFF